MVNKFYPTKRTNPCPVCSDTSGDCRTSDTEMILCHSSPDGGDHPLYKWIKPTEDQVWGIFLPRKEEISYEDRRQWLELQRRRQEQLERQAEEHSNGLTLRERDKAIRYLSRHAGLNSDHRQLLRDRGLGDRHIDSGLFFSVYPDMEAPPGINEKTPGIKSGKLCSKVKGIACPAFNAQGQAIGYQIRDENPGANNKYRWAKGTFTSHLQCGELPLSVAGNSENAVILSDGILKPHIASARLGGLRCIGASGGHFHRSPLQLRSAVGKLRRVIFAPDGGDILNTHTLRRIETTLSLFNHSYRVEIAWWGQYTKESLDIDELDNWDSVSFITLKQFQDLAKEAQDFLE